MKKRKKKKEPVDEFSKAFNEFYNALTATIKPLIAAIQALLNDPILLAKLIEEAKKNERKENSPQD